MAKTHLSHTKWVILRNQMVRVKDGLEAEILRTEILAGDYPTDQAKEYLVQLRATQIQVEIQIKDLDQLPRYVKNWRGNIKLWLYEKALAFYRQG